MAFREDDEALRHRVSSLEADLERARDEAEQLRRERDAAIARADAPPGAPTRISTPSSSDGPPTALRPAPWQSLSYPRTRWLLVAVACLGVLYWLLGPPPSPAGTHGIWSASSVHVGQGVFAEWSGRWYPAHVLATHGSSVRVHYEGLPSTDDEDVSVWRIRVR